MNNLAVAIKSLQVPTKEFRGNQSIEVTNADRALSRTLPTVSRQFDDVFEIPLNLITGNQNQSIAVDIVEPGISPLEVTGNDNVLAEKVFQDEVPWIVVRLVEPARIRRG